MARFEAGKDVGAVYWVRIAASLLSLLLAACQAPPQPLWLEVEAGPYPRVDCLVEWTLPSGVFAEEIGRLTWVKGDRGAEIPVQILSTQPARLIWMLEGEMPSHSSRAFRLEMAPPTAGGPPLTAVLNDGQLSLKHEGRERLRYHRGTQHPPAGVDPIYARSGYLHPVVTPQGRLVTADFPAAHRHHHGIWFPWTRTRFEGREVDFWNSAESQGKVESVGDLEYGAGPLCAWFRVHHRHLDLTAPQGPKAAVEEQWQVQAYAMPEVTLFDLKSLQSAASDEPLQLLTYHYGGLGFRGSELWEGDAVTFLTSEGKGRIDGHATRARWCSISGPVEGGEATMTIFCDPQNFRAPQPMRIHPSEPFFCYSPCQLGAFEISKERPLTSRYRFAVHDGRPEPAELDRLYRDFAEPPLVRLLAGEPQG